MALIPLSELYYHNTVYYFYLLMVCLIVDVALFYVIGVTFHTDEDSPLAEEFPDVRGFPALATRIFSFAFYMNLLLFPEYFENIICAIFPSAGDFVITSEFILGKIPSDALILTEKRELMFRIFWGLGHLVLLYFFAKGFQQHWRRGVAVRDASDNPEADVELSYDLIFKRSLGGGFANIFHSAEKYPVF